MDLKKAKEEFLIRYYRWSLLQGRLEVENGYPLLKRMDDSHCRRHIRRMEKLPMQAQQAFTALLIRRFNQQALELLGESPVTSEEEAEVRRYFDGLAQDIDLEHDRYLQSMMMDKPITKLDKRRFRKMIKERLTPILGREDPDGGVDWTYTTVIENQPVVTSIETGGSFKDLEYEHRINFAEDRYPYMGIRISFLGWIGLIASTVWWKVEGSKAEETACFLAELCNHFMKAAPELLKGLVL